MDYDKALKAAVEAAKEKAQHDGIDFGDRMYLPVKDRLVIFREHFGINLAIDTSLHTVDDMVMASAKVRTLDNTVLASGHAMLRIRDAAVETAETFAIGRALSCLGLIGSEYASANEMENIQPKRSPVLDNKVVRGHDPDDGLSEEQAEFKHEVEKAYPKVGVQPKFFRPMNYDGENVQKVFDEIDRINSVGVLGEYYDYIEHDFEWAMEKEDADEIKATFRARRDQLKGSR